MNDELVGKEHGATAMAGANEIELDDLNQELEEQLAQESMGALLDQEVQNFKEG